MIHSGNLYKYFIHFKIIKNVWFNKIVKMDGTLKEAMNKIIFLVILTLILYFNLTWNWMNLKWYPFCSMLSEQQLRRQETIASSEASCPTGSTTRHLGSEKAESAQHWRDQRDSSGLADSFLEVWSLDLRRLRQKYARPIPRLSHPHLREGNVCSSGHQVVQ